MHSIPAASMLVVYRSALGWLYGRLQPNTVVRHSELFLAMCLVFFHMVWTLSISITGNLLFPAHGSEDKHTAPVQSVAGGDLGSSIVPDN